MLYRLQAFEGEIPRLSDRLLGETQAAKAYNCDLASGEIRSLEQAIAVDTPAKTGTIQTIYRMGDPDGTHWWLHWTTDTDVVRGPVRNDQERTYYTVNDGNTTSPRKTDNSLVASGGDEYPNDSLLMGVPTPSSTPSASVSGTGSGNAVDMAYVYTLVTTWGEEGPPSDPTSTVTVEDGEDVDLSGLGGQPSGDYDFDKQRIYRTEGGEFLFVDEIDVSNSTYTDSSANSTTLGEPVPSTDWDEPPDEMIGLVSMANGILAGFRDQEILFSEPFQPHAWPSPYRLTVDWPIVGLGVFGNNLVVVTEGAPYIAQGTHPANMTLQRVPDVQPCIAKRGIVSSAVGVLYPTEEGIYRIGPDGREYVTTGLFSFQEWQDLNPVTLLTAAYHDGRYHVWFDHRNEGLIIPITRQQERVRRINFKATAAFNDPRDGELYYAKSVEGNFFIYRFRADTSPMIYRWRSKLIDVPPTNFGAAVIKADTERWADFTQTVDDEFVQNTHKTGDLNGGVINALPVNGDEVSRNTSQAVNASVTFRFFSNGTERLNRQVSSNVPFRLPAGFKSDRVQIEVSGNVPIWEIAFATSIRELP